MKESLSAERVHIFGPGLCSPLLPVPSRPPLLYVAVVAQLSYPCSSADWGVVTHPVQPSALPFTTFGQGSPGVDHMALSSMVF
jgi:hypothetical protein